MRRPIRHLALAGLLALVVAACSPPPAQSQGPAETDAVPSVESSSVESSSVESSMPELYDITERDPLPFPGYDVTRVTIAPLPGSGPRNDADVPTGWAAFDDEIVRSIIGGGSDAVSVAVAIDGEIVHDAAFGSRVPGTIEPVTTSDAFRIASISKLITAITVLQLVEDGVVGLDDPVGALVAGDVGVASPGAEVAAITVRQLLTHTAGFAKYENVFFGHEVESCEEAAAYGLSRPLTSKSFRYSNMNYCVLGLLIEHLTGEPYEQVVDERLLTPLGISGMRLAPTFDLGPGEVQHRTSPGRNYMEALGAAGAWVATPSDLVTIIDSLDADTRGWKPLEPSTVAQMKTSVNDPLAPDRGYGMGLILYGGGAFGHTGTIESTHAMVFDGADNVSWAITVSGENPSETVRLAGVVDRALAAGGFVPG